MVRAGATPSGFVPDDYSFKSISGLLVLFDLDGLVHDLFIQMHYAPREFMNLGMPFDQRCISLGVIKGLFQKVDVIVYEWFAPVDLCFQLYQPGKPVLHKPGSEHGKDFDIF
jgi:hypothetical protein